MVFKLRFPRADVLKWASRYEETPGERAIERLGARAQRRGYLERDEFLALCYWKSPRSQPHCTANSAYSIEFCTRSALSHDTPDELKILFLTSLSGVGWPTASVILHLCDVAPFPILDVRALWSLSHDVRGRYTRPLWHEYTLFTRRLAQKVGCNMRTLDRALWQYSKERQITKS